MRRSWDDYAGEITPKSAKGTRTVPLTALLRDHLDGPQGKDRAGRARLRVRLGGDRPFQPSHVIRRGRESMGGRQQRSARRAKPRAVPIELHSCRHTFVSLMHDAGLSLERIGDYVGTAPYMTDRYRHLLEGHEQEAARISTNISLVPTRRRALNRSTEGGDAELISGTRWPSPDNFLRVLPQPMLSRPARSRRAPAGGTRSSGTASARSSPRWTGCACVAAAAGT